MEAYSPSDVGSSAWDRVPLDSDDPILRLETNIGRVVEYFGPDAREMIKKSMEQDALNVKNLEHLETKLKNQGDWEAANRVVKLVREACKNTSRQVLPMRRHLLEIAGDLADILQPEVQTDPKELFAVLSSIRDSSEAARKMATDGAKNYEALVEHLQSVQLDYQGKKSQAEKQRDDNKKLADEKGESAEQQMRNCAHNTLLSITSGSVTLGKGGVGVTALAGGAEAVAGIPILGAALTTTTISTAPASGILGFCGFTTTTTALAFNPVGIMVGTGFAVGFGIMALKTWSDACVHRLQAEAALQEQKAAETQAKSCEDLVNESAKTQSLAGDLANKAKTHEVLWEGVSDSAEKAAHTFATWTKIDPNGARRKKFDQKMNIYAEDLCHFVQAIDEYLFYLSKNDFFPPNFPLQRELGADRVRELELKWKSTARQLQD